MVKDYGNIVTQLKIIRKRLNEINQDVKQLQKKAIENKETELIERIKKFIFS